MRGGGTIRTDELRKEPDGWVEKWPQSCEWGERAGRMLKAAEGLQLSTKATAKGNRVRAEWEDRAHWLEFSGTSEERGDRTPKETYGEGMEGKKWADERVLAVAEERSQWRDGMAL